MSIVVDNVSKVFGSQRALNGVSLTLERGEGVGLLGPNGAGKSTTLKAVFGLLRVSEGHVVLDGKNITNATPQALVAAGMAAELGSMKVTEQIDAITMLRTDPVEYLVVPRVLAMLVMSPVQCLLFFGIGMWSGMLSSSMLYRIPPPVFWSSMRTWMQPSDVPSMLLKATVFGLEIAIIACGWGLTTRGGPKEVGTSTTGAVVMILLIIAITDVILTQVLYG